MQTLRLIIAASALALLLPVAGSAQDADPLADMTREQRQEYLQGLSVEERKALRDQRRAQWNAMSEEERTAAREKLRAQREQRRETWNSLSPEQQAAARQELRKHRNKPRGQRTERRSRQP